MCKHISHKIRNQSHQAFTSLSNRMSTPAASSTPVAPPAAAPPRKWTPQEIAAFPVCTKIAAYNGKPCRAKRVPWQRACNCGGCPCHCFCFSTDEKRQKYERNVQNAQKRNAQIAEHAAAQIAAPSASLVSPPAVVPPTAAPATTDDVCPTLGKYGYCSCGNGTPEDAQAKAQAEWRAEVARRTAQKKEQEEQAAKLAAAPPDEKEEYDFADEEDNAVADAAWLKIPVGEFRPPVPIHDRRWLREEHRDMLVMFISLHELTLRGMKKMKGWKRCDDPHCDHMDCFAIDIRNKMG